MHVIAAKAVAFKTMSKDFNDYQKQIVKNARIANELRSGQ
jgi:glycine/serine hydroxymethyltransferase